MVQITPTVFTAPYITLGTRWRTALYTAFATVFFWTVSSAPWDALGDTASPHSYLAQNCTCPDDFVVASCAASNHSLGCCECTLLARERDHETTTEACEWSCPGRS